MEFTIPKALKAELEALPDVLRLHAETEEQVLYPAGILVGEAVRMRLGA